MGRIKTQFMKRLAFELIKEHKSELKSDYDENKKLVEQFLTRPTKKVRNVVAGYVTRLMKKKEEY
ncbi:MAG: 30S ribosomal protein S17e [Candidatus Woesearchaeota archaeon]